MLTAWYKFQAKQSVIKEKVDYMPWNL